MCTFPFLPKPMFSFLRVSQLLKIIHYTASHITPGKYSNFVMQPNFNLVYTTFFVFITHSRISFLPQLFAEYLLQTQSEHQADLLPFFVTGCFSPPGQFHFRLCQAWALVTRRTGIQTDNWLNRAVLFCTLTKAP